MTTPTNEDDREVEEVAPDTPPVDAERRADRDATTEDPSGLEDARHAAATELPPVP